MSILNTGKPKGDFLINNIACFQPINSASARELLPKVFIIFGNANQEAFIELLNCSLHLKRTTQKAHLADILVALKLPITL